MARINLLGLPNSQYWEIYDWLHRNNIGNIQDRKLGNLGTVAEVELTDEESILFVLRFS